MSDKSKIEWTESTWNPIVGCSIVSPGCTNCYAMRTAGARTKHTAKYSGLTKVSKAGPVWTGEIRLWERALRDPLKWKTPRRIFVNSMGDLFHESIPDEWIDKVFAVMALAPRHVFQVLTKRAQRMREYMTARTAAWDVGHACGRVSDLVEQMRRDRGDVIAVGPIPHLPPGARWWPLANVWLGVSAERQEEADERIPLLLETPAAIRFVSLEPLLWPIDLTDWLHDSDCDIRWRGVASACTCSEPREVSLDWAIVGAETGSRARPMRQKWARSLRDQCARAGVPFFFKQWGEWGPSTREPETLARLGRKATGRLLDGREWNEFPEATPA